ncbi:hypothetical protein [Streptomyces sp. A1547]|uniref:hypothetical protein n=1 Tax=Streptomyces sp. A1547 TaxID=2563105 RepID=UPI00109EADD0|nr:hypothetical protein [Streptomyces sp. A1547]THA29040.1 hypothetical protein E6W17_40150 [Streptomyces sp. A1547]
METQLSSTNSRECAGLHLPDCSSMSTSNALPVLRTSDLVGAHQAVQRLLSLAIPMDKFQVNAEAQALTPAEAQRMVAAFPKSTVSPDDPYRPESNGEVRRMIAAGDPQVTALLPVTLHLESQPVGSIEEAFFAVIGSGRASIDWDFFSWPAVPELDLEIRNKDAYVQIAINSRDVGRDVPATDHTVFIHFRSGDVERAEWLAQQVGLQPIGPVEWGW